MATDLKYGQVTFEKGTIGDDEPVFVLRARDAMVPALIVAYMDMCRDAGSPPRHIDQIARNLRVFTDWQTRNPTQVPQSLPPDASQR